MNIDHVWNTFSEQLLGYILKHINDRELALDIRQDIFIKLHLNVNKIKRPDQINKWLYSTTRNTIVDHYRKKHVQTTTLDPDDLLVFEEETDTTDFSSCLRPFLMQLPDKDREALEATILGNQTQKAFAETIGVPYSTAKSRVKRALNKLHHSFVECCDVVSDSYGNPDPQKECKYSSC